MDSENKNFFSGLIVGIITTALFCNISTNEFIKLYLYGVLASGFMSLISAYSGALESASRHNKNPLNTKNPTSPLKEFKRRSIDDKYLVMVNLLSWYGALGMLILAIKDLTNTLQYKNK